MPGPLKNPKHEAFVRGLLENKTALDAYEAAGYARDDANAARLSRNPKVQKRLAELQTEVTNETKVTVAGLISELEAARKAATNLEQFSTVVKSIEAKARISGLLVEKKQVEVGGPGEFDGLNSVEDILDKLASEMLGGVNWWHGVTEDDHAQLVAIFADSFERADALLTAIKARPPTKLHINAPPSQSRS